MIHTSPLQNNFWKGCDLATLEEKLVYEKLAREGRGFEVREGVLGWTTKRKADGSHREHAEEKKNAWHFWCLRVIRMTEAVNFWPAWWRNPCLAEHNQEWLAVPLYCYKHNFVWPSYIMQWFTSDVFWFIFFWHTIAIKRKREGVRTLNSSHFVT